MSFLLDPNSAENLDKEFYAVVEHLKSQNVLPQHSFIQSLPFFNFHEISKESHIKELFENSCDPSQSKALLQNIFLQSEGADLETISNTFASSHVMSFAQIILYKVLPCPHEQCARHPREIATHNQYTDPEYECPFYHHERDRRRLVINLNPGDEFMYKANYFEEGKRTGDKDKYSQNYFESMFHPLYYKMFKCKRHYCNSCRFCPFFHNEEEKMIWDQVFSSFVKKDRASYVKDKQRYYEGSSNYSSEGRNYRMENNENANKNLQYAGFRPRVQKNKRQSMQQAPQGNENKGERAGKWQDWSGDRTVLYPKFSNGSKQQEVC